MLLSIFNNFNICILTLQLHTCNIAGTYYFSFFNTSFKMADKSWNMLEDYRVVVYYCTCI